MNSLPLPVVATLPPPHQHRTLRPSTGLTGMGSGPRKSADMGRQNCLEKAGGRGSDGDDGPAKLATAERDGRVPTARYDTTIPEGVADAMIYSCANPWTRSKIDPLYLLVCVGRQL